MRAFAWPDSAAWRTFAWCALWLNAEWILVYGGADWLAGRHTFRVSLTPPLMESMAFVPQAAWIYLSLFPLLWLAPFRLQSAARIRRFAIALAWLIAISGACFVMLPREPWSTPANSTQLDGTAFRFADRMNLTFNYLPSLHVGMATLCAYAYSRSATPALAAAFAIWSTAIAASTLLTHQHDVVDAAAGVVAGLLIAARWRV